MTPLWPPLPFCLSLPHALCGSAVLLCPGGGPSLVGHGGRTLAPPAGLGVRVVGLAVGFGVARGVGLAVGAAVDRAVGALVGAAVGAVVAAAVGAAVGPAAGCWVGAGVDPGARVGAIEATATVGEGDADTTCPDGDATGPDGDPEGAGWLACPGLVEGAAEVAPGAGVGVDTTATGGWRDGAARCWSPTPPMPIAIVARTRFRTPRLRTSRAR
jgi:hypothetical protein